MALMGKMACTGKIVYWGMLASEIIGSQRKIEIFAFKFIFFVSIKLDLFFLISGTRQLLMLIFGTHQTPGFSFLPKVLSNT